MNLTKKSRLLFFLNKTHLLPKHFIIFYCQGRLYPALPICSDAGIYWYCWILLSNVRCIFINRTTLHCVWNAFHQETERPFIGNACYKCTISSSARGRWQLNTFSWNCEGWELLIRSKLGNNCTFNFMFESLIHWSPVFVYFLSLFATIWSCRDIYSWIGEHLALTL